jgi:hypothetical protein
LRRRWKTVTDEDRPHRGRRYGDAQALQFADDSPITPARVLPGKPNNERPYPTIERRPPRALSALYILVWRLLELIVLFARARRFAEIV